eukprot:gene15837-21458_t
MSSTLLAIKASSEAISGEQKRLLERKRNILILINSFLIENGYIDTSERLQHETNYLVNKYSIADNIDLGLIMSEYEVYYEMRYDKKPKIAKKLNENETNELIGNKGSNSIKSNNKKQPNSNNNNNNTNKDKRKDSNDNIITPNSNNNLPNSNKLPLLNGGVSQSTEPETNFSVQGSSISTMNNNTKKPVEEKIDEKLLKPPPQFGGDSELKQLSNVISREIYQASNTTRFEDIIGLDEAKRLLIEAVQLPLRFPGLFTGILRPWKGILLHGPPGTGKTLLAKAVATECQTTFFNISASTLVSKWRGDSEKLVRVLFEVARYHSPSTIFLDEIDSILTSRGGEGGEHEASRRMKTELLIQMDGITNNNSTISEQVFVMAASNLPWDLDVAVLRRLEKRVLVSLPSTEARLEMLSKHLSDRVEEGIQFDEIANSTNGYSGADVELLCREAAMIPVRRLMKKLSDLEQSNIAQPPPPI